MAEPLFERRPQIATEPKQVHPARNIVLCLDGTSNKFSAVNTNVVKLYSMLDRTILDHSSYYQPGIGTIVPPGTIGHVKRWVLKHMDLAIAWLLSTHVTDAYRFLMRYYRAGDHIFLFGFSRGAYTARAVAAMLHRVGLLSPGNEELIPFAWDIFADSGAESDHLADSFKATFSRKVHIHFLGLWDTVASIGWMWDPKHLPNTSSNPSVRTIRYV